MNAPEKNAAGQAKKPYRSPVIRYYGAIRAITETVGKRGASDGGSGVKKKTMP